MSLILIEVELQSFIRLKKPRCEIEAEALAPGLPEDQFIYCVADYDTPVVCDKGPLDSSNFFNFHLRHPSCLLFLVFSTRESKGQKVEGCLETRKIQAGRSAG